MIKHHHHQKLNLAHYRVIRVRVKRGDHFGIFGKTTARKVLVGIIMMIGCMFNLRHGQIIMTQTARVESKMRFKSRRPPRRHR